jgi:hypothetical protein
MDNETEIIRVLSRVESRQEIMLEHLTHIDTHLESLNGRVSDTILKLSKTEDFAKAADLKAEKATVCDAETNRRIDSWVRATIVASVGAIAAVAAAILALIRVKG